MAEGTPVKRRASGTAAAPSTKSTSNGATAPKASKAVSKAAAEPAASPVTKVAPKAKAAPAKTASVKAAPAKKAAMAEVVAPKETVAKPTAKKGVATSAKVEAAPTKDCCRQACTGEVGACEVVEAADRAAGPRRRPPFALVVLHPDDGDDNRQAKQANRLVDALRRAGIQNVVAVLPNNDPGWPGIARTWRTADSWDVRADVVRDDFLGLLRDATVLVGNSSSGVIEAASLGTPVVNVGARQRGRERSGNVIDVDWRAAALNDAIARVWNGGAGRRFRGRNVYGGGDAGLAIAGVLATLDLGPVTRRKLISY